MFYTSYNYTRTMIRVTKGGKIIAPQKVVRGTRTAALSAPRKNRNAAVLPLSSQCYMIRWPL